MKNVILFLTVIIFAAEISAQMYYGTNHFIRNDFPGGKVIIDGVEHDVPLEPIDRLGLPKGILGVYKSWSSGSGHHSVTALNSQSVNGQHAFDSWEQNGAGMGSSLTYSFHPTVGYPDPAEHEAQYTSTYTVNFTGASTINVNGTNYNTPTPNFDIVEPSGITATAPQTYLDNGIIFTFQKWSDNSTSYSKTFYPTGNFTYAAEYIGIPDKAPLNTSINSDQPGSYVKLTWTEHPNTNVTQYRIYRGAKVEGNFSDPIVIGTRNRGTTSFTDFNYIIGGSNPNSVAYDVVPYYSIEGTWGFVGGEYIVSATQTLLKTNDTTGTKQQIIADYNLSNYPNPFNPSTNINFSIPEAARVKLTIYNMLGEKVRELLDKNIEAGSYDAQWNGVDQSGKKVISGVYFSVLQTNDKRIVQKMILSK